MKYKAFNFYSFTPQSFFDHLLCGRNSCLLFEHDLLTRLLIPSHQSKQLIKVVFPNIYSSLPEWIQLVQFSSVPRSVVMPSFTPLVAHPLIFLCTHFLFETDFAQHLAKT